MLWFVLKIINNKYICATCTYLILFTIYKCTSYLHVVWRSPKWTVDNSLAQYTSHFPHNQILVSVAFLLKKKGWGVLATLNQSVN